MADLFNFLSNSVAVEPGNQLLSPERKKNTLKCLSEGEVDSNTQSKYTVNSTFSLNFY